jgi:hypothetical protein
MNCRRGAGRNLDAIVSGAFLRRGNQDKISGERLQKSQIVVSLLLFGASRGAAAPQLQLQFPLCPERVRPGPRFYNDVSIFSQQCARGKLKKK